MKPSTAEPVTIKAMFARIAHHYDAMNRLMTFGRDGAWRQFAAEAATAHSGLVLDAATGTGDLALALARHGATVVGVDFCGPMMALARAKVTAAGFDERIRFVEGDLLSLPFADSTFAAVASAFALRNVASIPDALAEMRRVVAPGGRVVILELTRPHQPVFRTLSRLYLHLLVPLVGGLATGQPEAYVYLPDSIDRFLSLDELHETMEQVGLRAVYCTQLTLGTVAVHVGVK